MASNGYIEKAKVNLLLQSNSFDSATWPKPDATVTSGQSGYDGSNDAWLLDSTTAGGNINQGYSVTGVVNFSIYAKKGTADGIRIRFDKTTDSNLYIDLNDGSEANTPTNLIDYSATNIGSGWYKISMAFLSAGPILFRIYPTDDTGTAVIGTIYIQDAQLNYGLVAQDYVETTTTSVVSGITNDLPRLDYSGGASCPSLKLEPSRQNLIPHSEYAGSWALNGVTIQSNDITSPEGVINATEVFASGSAGNRLERTGFSLSGDYTFSVFLKKGTSTKTLFFDGVKGVQIDWSSDGVPVVTGHSGGVPAAFDYDDYGNSWYRVWFRDSYSGTRSFQIFPDRNGGSDSVYFYGAQLEAGSYPTSYIPTYGTSNSRNSESCSKTGISSLIGQTEGSVFIDFDLNALEQSGQRIFRIGQSGLSFANAVSLEYNPPNQLQFINYASGILNVQIIKTTTTSERLKIAVRYKENDFAMYVNGVQIGTDTSATLAGSFADFFVGGNSVAASGQIGSGINQFLIFQTGLTNAQLAELSTL